MTVGCGFQPVLSLRVATVNNYVNHILSFVIYLSKLKKIIIPNRSKLENRDKFTT